MGAAVAPSLKVPPSTRAHPPVPNAVSALVRRLWPRLKRPAEAPQGGASGFANDSLQEAGRRLRQARESRGLGLRQLAQETRVSTAVIEALERGWPDRLPEPAYLRTMLPLLERHLELSPGSLGAALPGSSTPFRGSSREPLARRFTPGSIDVFTSWQGTLLYGLVTLGLIQLLNLQQFRLASRGLHSTHPIPPIDQRGAATAGAADAAVLAAYPDLRPIDRAAAGQALQRWRAEAGSPTPNLALGQLDLQLANPTRLELTGSRGGNTSLDALRGQLSLPVLPPFRLRLDPVPEAGSVRWNGKALAPVAGQAGSFAYPPPAAPQASSQPTPSAPAPSAAAPRP